MTPIFKRVLLELKPHYKRLWIIGITGVLYSVAYSRLAIIIKDLQEGLQSGNKIEFLQLTLFTLGLAIIIAGSRYVHIFLMNYVAEIVVTQYRLKLQKKFMHLSVGFHNDFVTGSGGLLSRILNDIRVIQDGLRMVADFFREPLLAILLLGNLFYLNWRLTLSLMVVLPFVLYFLRQISRSLRKYVILGQENLERITLIIKESLDGLRTIQSFNLEKRMADKLTVETDVYLDIRKKVHARVELMGPITEFVATCLILFIFFHFSVEISKGVTTVGAVLAYITSLLMLNPPIKKLQESYVRIQETMVAAERVYSILDNNDVVIEHDVHNPFPTNWQTIEYKNVSFAYGNEQVLKNINLTIRRGEQLAFVGESGSGKSTLVNLLERFFEPKSGSILIDGINIQEIDLKDLRKNIALVSQDVFLFSDTIENNIWAGDLAKTKDRVEEVSRSANAHDFINKTSKAYLSTVGDRGNLLSGGEKQRISIARALFKDAPILIMDEATSALDSSSEIEVQKGLEKLMQGRTSLVIAHRLSTVQAADRIIVLKKGEIVETGKHSDLLSQKGEYHRFFTLQTTAFLS
ncbi:MAG: ABC transporter ATP-binding protein [Bdellovibrionota bacterium]